MPEHCEWSHFRFREQRPVVGRSSSGFIPSMSLIFGTTSSFQLILDRAMASCMVVECSTHCPDCIVPRMNWDSTWTCVVSSNKQVACHANVQNAVASVGHDVDATASLHGEVKIVVSGIRRVAPPY